MNPYVSFGLAMCVVVLVSLLLTGYLAMHFNRRAQADLETALRPLAEVLDGSMDLEKPEVKGRFRGQIAGGVVATDQTKMGRVFHSWLIDAAGGERWTYTVRRGSGDDAGFEESFDGGPAGKRSDLQRSVSAALTPYLTGPGWLRVEYDPAPGHVRLTRPMRTRRDIPSVEQFERHLELLAALGQQNRELQSKIVEQC